jgi:hypothetical protein
MATSLACSFSKDEDQYKEIDAFSQVLVISLLTGSKEVLTNNSQLGEQTT